MATAQTDYIAFMGTKSQYVGLKIEATNSGYTLKTEYTYYVSGFRNITEQVSIERVTDEDEAIDVATDLEYDAAKFLTNMDVAETTGGLFGEKVEKWLDAAELKAA